MNKEEINDLRKENKKLLQELHDMRYKKEIEELQEKYTQALEVAQERFDRIQKAIELLELTEARKKVCTDFVNVGRKRYDEILNILKGGNNE